MIIDHRTYTIEPRKVGEYLKIYEEYALPVQKKYLGEPLFFGSTQIGPNNELVQLWQYADMADYERKRAQRDADPDWDIYLKKTIGIVQKQETKLVAPTGFSKIR